MLLRKERRKTQSKCFERLLKGCLTDQTTVYTEQKYNIQVRDYTKARTRGESRESEISRVINHRAGFLNEIQNNLGSVRK